MITGIAKFALLVTLAIGAVIGIWYVSEVLTTAAKRDISRESQQYQDATVTRLRILTEGMIVGTGDQAALFQRQFCTLYGEVDDPPADLASAHSDYC